MTRPSGERHSARTGPRVIAAPTGWQRAGRWARTLRHLRAGQLAALVRQRAWPPPAPRPWRSAAPRLCRERAVLPFLPPPAHARVLAGGELELLRRRLRVDERIAWGYAEEGPLWAYHLHHHDWLRHPMVSPRRRAAILLDWVARHPPSRAGARDTAGWQPHPTSLRILAWGKLLLAPGALALDDGERAALLASLAAQVDYVARNPERWLQANHLLSNRLAAAFGARLLAVDGPRRWAEAPQALQRELARQIGEDGAHEERSPMYHALLLEGLLDLLNLECAGGRSDTGALREVAARMLGALQLWTHPDGEIALFGDSAFGIAQPPAALQSYAQALGVEPRRPASGWLVAAGFARLEAGPFTLIASVAGPSPAHQPGHAHCDALSFELSVGRERLVTDGGVPEYIPGSLRDACRSTGLHATARVGEAEQAEIWAAHRVGGRPRVSVELAEPPRVFEASCSAWSTPDTLHRRRFSVRSRSIEVGERLAGRPRRVRLTLPLAPATRVELKAGGARLTTPGGRRLRLSLPGAHDGSLRWRVESLPYFPEFGLRLERPALVGEGDAFREGRWRLELGS